MPQALDHSSSLRYRGLCISRRVAAASTGDSACAPPALTAGGGASWNDSHLARAQTVDQSPPPAPSGGIDGAIPPSAENAPPPDPAPRRPARFGGRGSDLLVTRR